MGSRPFGALVRWLSPWRGRGRRLEQYLETEEHECADAVDRQCRERDEKERQIGRECFSERREGSNWLESREMRLSAMVLEHERALVANRIEIRRRLALECPALLSDAEVSKLQESLLGSLQVARQGRWEDYKRRAVEAGVLARRSPQEDAAGYGDLEALVRREIRKLVLDRSSRRLGGRGLSRRMSGWVPLMKLTTAVLGLAASAVALYLVLHKR